MSKKSMPSVDNIRIKQEIKEECKDYDPALHARDRLKGALQDLQALHSDNSSDSDDYRIKTLPVKKSEKDRNFQKRRKHKMGMIKEIPFQHTFVMKLFDRSVDLAQFEENTPLYPICRAWMANKPRSFINAKIDKESYKKQKREEKREKEKFKTKMDNGLLKDVYTLPAPLPPEADRSLLEPNRMQTVTKSKDFKLPAENDKNLPTKDILLATHIAHWCEVKKMMKAAALRREKRFEASKNMLKRIFHNAQ
ncbi:UNVERIFIED_CONTAM: hypothetical protein PYX00_008089 [Menopon gallinae]|uniref:Protein lin-37 homolog n=1 Tax=Menopon gallinae TaxID=328185 RepID=A0AAW2HLY1_9NEOP